MMHDFAITEEHAIFLDSPIAFNFSGDNGPMVQWKPEYGTRLGVMPRLGQADEIKWYEVENGHVQHFWNAWAENGRIEISGTRLANPEFGMDAQEDIQDSGADAEAGRPTKYWVDLEKGTAGWEQFDDMGGDFCRINDNLNGVETRYHYMSGFYGKADVMGDFDAIVKYDYKTGKRSRWFSGETSHVGEPVFAPDPSGTAEDDGWLLATCHDDATNESQVVVLDAQDVDAGPIARVHMPRRLPFGFHANWFPADT
jgi:carotenoid cleavage dioxygenase